MKKVKNVLITIFLIVLTFGLSGCGNNQNADKSNSNHKEDMKTSVSEDNFEWDGNIIIALTDKGAKQESLIIPERCEGFNGWIFADKENNVKSVSFESDKNIDLNGVFGSAENLISISLPSELSEVGDLEFWLCSSLQEITIPSGVTVIGEYAFQNNKSLEKIVFEGDVTCIMPHAFDGCGSLKTVTLPDTVEVIGEYAFYQCESLEKIVLPSSLSEVGGFAFANSGVTAITIPSDVNLMNYETTSFVQADHDITITVTEGSWIDQNFDNVFNGAFIKSYGD